MGRYAPVKPLWQCPNCGQTFVSPNLPHSCLVVDLDSHFEGTTMRPVFDALLAAVEENGPVTVNATKSRITFQVRMRFGGVEKPRREHLVAHFVLTRALASERLRAEFIAPIYYVHRVRLTAGEEIDAELRRWYAEAYQVGEQRHLARKSAKRFS